MEYYTTTIILMMTNHDIRQYLSFRRDELSGGRCSFLRFSQAVWTRFRSTLSILLEYPSFLYPLNATQRFTTLTMTKLNSKYLWKEALFGDWSDCLKTYEKKVATKQEGNFILVFVLAFPIFWKCNLMGKRWQNIHLLLLAEIRKYQ